jgi:uncharacterized protein (DUF4415 family)
MNARNSRKKSGTDWQYLKDESDEGIDFSDIPRLGPEFWKKAELRLPQKKESLTLRLDHDVVAWFRSAGRGYQTKMNAVLRSYMRSARHA